MVDSVDVRLVNVDVVVTDPDGTRRRDLGRDDFRLYEDGQEVEIRHFVPPEAATPQAASTAEPVVAVAPGADDPGAELPRLVIFFDLLRLEAADRRRLAEALRDVLHEAPPLRTMIVTNHRSMHIRLPFTAEPVAWTELLTEIERVEPGRLGGFDERNSLAEEFATVQRLLVAADTPNEVRRAESRRASALAQLDSMAGALESEIRGTLGALHQLTASLGGVEGRKLLLYVGDNLELSPIRELFEEAQLTLGQTEVGSSRLASAAATFELSSEFDHLLREANAQGVTFYGVTPKNRGGVDVAERSFNGATVVAGALGFQGRLPSKRQELVKEAVCRLTIESGGLCQAGGTEPRLLLRATLDDVDSTYSLAYAPEHPPDGEFHRLEVEVLQPELDVRHREGYVDKAAESRLHDRLAAALLLGDADDALEITVTPGEVAPPGSSSAQGPRRSLVPLEVRVSVDRLGLVPIQGGQQVGAKARLLVQTQNEQGGVSSVQEYPVAFQVAGDRLTAQPPLAYAHMLHLLLEPGQYQVAIGLWDEVGRVGSFVSHDVVVE